ncbi:hypothetical protein EXU30_00350 [Shewanella maritima]|uniref:Uncharacterized protein n=1 Tax=Shewanella maritima TaxID=2520507 RepID=A0A411PD64_9GAMM|nr:hypothetical protein [Shewanella maritima]QBF81320.1 hypothetical protein EXU30_00350 [Shewanella maritima]
MNEHLSKAMKLHRDIVMINEFLLKRLAPEQAQAELNAKVAVLLGELDDELSYMEEEVSCELKHVQAA